MTGAGAGLLVVGAGGWGRNLVRNFEDLGALGGVCELDPGLRKGVGRDHPGIPTWESVEEALAARPWEGVVVATPVPTHFELARQALRAGFPVFLEKPMALRSAESRELVDLSRRSGLLLMVGHLPLFLPAIEELRRIVDSGLMGEILYLQARRVNLGKVRHQENVLWSLAPHDVAVFLHLLQEMPLQVQCFGRAWLQPGIEDLAFLELRFPGGRIAQAHFSWIDPSTERLLKVVGRKGMAVVDELSPTPLRVTDRRYEPETGLTIPGHDRFPLLPSELPLARECRHFLHCLRSGEPPRSGADLGHRVVRILEAATQSLREGGAWQVLEEDSLDRPLSPVPSGR